MFFIKIFIIFLYLLDETTYTELYDSGLSAIQAGVWTNFIVTLDNFTGTDQYIVIKHGYEGGLSFLIDDFIYEVNPTASVNENLIDNISIYPNPVKNKLNIKLNENINSIEVFNILGRKIYSKNEINHKNITLDTSNYQNGIYVLKVNNSVSKFIKK